MTLTIADFASWERAVKRVGSESLRENPIQLIFYGGKKRKKTDSGRSLHPLAELPRRDKTMRICIPACEDKRRGERRSLLSPRVSADMLTNALKFISVRELDD